MSSPPVKSLLRRSRALPIALGACLVGLLLCGLTYAVAGETVHTRDIDLLDPIPDGIVVVIDDTSCAPIVGTGDDQCRRHLRLYRDGVPAEQLIDELAARYHDRGFDLNPMPGTNRTYFGSFGTCGPQLFIGGAQAAGDLNPIQPGVNGPIPRRPNPMVPTTPLTSTTSIAPAVTDPAAGDPNTAVSSPAEPGLTAEAAPAETVPGETTVTEPAPAGLGPGETVVVDSSPVPPTTLAVDPSDTTGVTPYSTYPTYPGASPSAGVPDPYANIVSVELAEPFPGMC